MEKESLRNGTCVYDYAYYNDLGNPDKGPKYVRPVLGGSSEYPYPRRGRTGRAAAESAQFVKPELEALCDSTPNEFDSFDDLSKLHEEDLRFLKEFPPKSKLNSKQYGDQNSSITEEHIKGNLDGLTMDEAIKNNRMFILDHHDKLMPYLRRINATATKTYASRTLLFLKDDGSHL
ncbi:hypothetical protein OIU85_005041 [Salix viminalis]|uniref:Lipoxygenase domain-containing protein n=1 Tax=Salix viminalis TaxID=40686 RepID=A0A9Q0PU16_SALVM|nr:hypothetical protein OIU85_005041 [Salix viminalis]